MVLSLVSLSLWLELRALRCFAMPVSGVNPEAQCEPKEVIKADKSDIGSTNDPSEMTDDTLFISESACHSPRENDGTRETFIQAHNYLIACPESCREGFGLYLGENGWIDEDKRTESGA
ncbi:hypothetical protein QQF64_022652 [Cirrhinus molitorella]|uniref:Secreted protein n=1 Tax=Cirrhinus molitorella TaxID=172907 RepID=A0ABR3L583_9TELE